MPEGFLLKLRELIRAEAEAAVAASMEDESGYCGNNHAEKSIADSVFAELLKMV